MSNDDNTPRTLGGAPVNDPIPESWRRPSSNQNSRSSSSSGPRIGRVGGWSSGGGGNSSHSGGSGRIATLRDIGSGSGSGPPLGGFGGSGGGFGGLGGIGRGGSDDDDDDDDERRGGDDGEGESWFAGGERSGISVQNPGRGPGGANEPGGDLVRELLRRAAEAGAAQREDDGHGHDHGHAASSWGAGHTLGSEEVESQFIPDPDAPEPEEEEPAIRQLTLWRDGFSVDDGELMRYGVESNDEILEQITAGHAPPHILNVRQGQPVELRVVRRLHQDYILPPKGPSLPFEGAGHRLGSPVPPVVGAAGSSDMPGGFPNTSSRTAPRDPIRDVESIGTRFEVDQTQPTTSVQIRLADGTRMVCRMNLTHTVQDIRNFINAARPENNTRPYAIMTTFPNRTLEDEKQTIKDAGLVNAVVVQRWL
ncbi:ubiquitin-related domain-containing protein [Abortiporus biennis]|nr:ubiquitin-related domain-containing protein [Abortiporus biennis]